MSVAILRKNYRDIKPPLGSQLNFGHPLSQGLVGCWLMNEGGGLGIKDATGKNNGTLINGVLWKNSGRIYFDGSDDRATAQIPLTKSGSLVLKVRILTLSPGTNEGLWSNRSTSNHNWLQMSAYDAQTTFDIEDGATERFITFNGLKKDKDYVLVMTWREGIDIVGYFDGIYQDKLSSASIKGPTSTVTSYLATYYDLSSARSCNCEISYAFAYNRSLQPSEIKSLYEAPYQMIQPRVYRYFSISKGVTPTPPIVTPSQHQFIMCN